MLALRHPVREHRMMAIQLLGDMKSQAAVPAFRSIIRAGDDFYAIRQIIVALSKIGNDECLDIIRSLKDHESRLVSRFARQMLKSFHTVSRRSPSRD